jgi:hypothetical protein
LAGPSMCINICMSIGVMAKLAAFRSIKQFHNTADFGLP